MRAHDRLIPALLTVLTLSLGQPAQAGGGPECWRRGGPPALSALMTEHAEAIRLHREGKPVANWEKISSDLDAVAAQRDAWASGLYWYTNLDEAKAAAKRENKPIVSLRMLGRLDADLSCANSRFFRTTLYPAAEVSKRLRENFVLYWSSERPVPVVTVDFGDGRTMKRTITGNSAHYMLTPDGDVVDVLPGLYGAKPFAAWLDDAGRLARQVAGASDSDRDRTLRAYHARKATEAADRFAADVQIAAPPARRINGVAGVAPANRAGRLSISKTIVEAPLVAGLSIPDPASADTRTWTAVASLHAADAAIDPTAVALIRSKRPAGDFNELLATLQRSIAQDTVRNEYSMHRTIHGWFANATAPTDFAALNERVYAELFLTPRADPWLGLAPKDVWSGLEDDGLSRIETAAAK